MLNLGVVFGLKRVVLSINKPFSCIKLLSRNANAFAIILRWPNPSPRHKFTRYGAVGPFDHRGRCFSKEITATSAHSEKDILFERLVLARNPRDVLATVGDHISIMNTKHLIQALESLFKLRKLDPGFSTKIPTTQPEFVALCKSLKSQIRGIELNETVDVLKIVTLFGLESSNGLVQALLQMIRHKVNDLSLQQIVYLHFLLTKMVHCPLVDALQIALPLVFDVQLNTKLDRTNIHHLANMLQYAIRTKASYQSLETLIESLTTLINSGEVLDMRTARTITLALTSNHIDQQVPLGKLLQRSLATLAEKIKECDLKDVDLITSKLTDRIFNERVEFYNEGFMDGCSTYIVEKDCGVFQGCWIMKNLTKIRHTNLGLLNYLAKKIVADQSSFTECRPITLFTVVSGFSAADYKPDDWQIIRDLILNHRLLVEGQLELPWMKFGIELASLGCFSSTLLERIFQEDFLRKFLQRNKGTDKNYMGTMQVMKLHQAVVSLYPSYGGPSPPKDILDHADTWKHRRHLNHEFPLEAALVRGLGGANYLQTNLFTRSHIFVDHVIVMRKGGFPIALSPPVNPDGSKVCIEDLEVPANSQIIAVVAMNNRCFSRNSGRMLGDACLYIRCLEALNLSVVPVPLQLWSRMPEHERIPYLMQSIKHKCADSVVVSVQQ